MYAEIYLPISIIKTFSYLITPHLESLIKEGHLVSVPFGKITTIGYVNQVVEKQSFLGKLKSEYILNVTTDKYIMLGKYVPI